MEPPDPIPNSVVKHGSADDTAVSGRGKVGRRLIFFCLEYRGIFAFRAHLFFCLSSPLLLELALLVLRRNAEDIH